MGERQRRQRCVTCKPSEWKAIRASARAADMDISAFILSRVLDGESPDGPPHPKAGYPMALTGEEQRRQLEVLERLVEDSRRFLDEPVIPGTAATMREAMAFLVHSSTPGEFKTADRSSAEPSRGQLKAGSRIDLSPQSEAPSQLELLGEITEELNRENTP